MASGAISKPKPKPKAPGYLPPSSGSTFQPERAQKLYQIVYIVTSALYDPDVEDEPTSHDTSNVFRTLDEANTAAWDLARQIGWEPDDEKDDSEDSEGGFMNDREDDEAYEEEFTDDGRIIIHCEAQAGNKLDIQVEERELEDSARVCVFIGEYQRYTDSMEFEIDTDNVIGVFRSPENANKAARKYLEREWGEVGEVSRDESHDSLGGITINVEDAKGRNHCCLVDRYTIRD